MFVEIVSAAGSRVYYGACEHCRGYCAASITANASWQIVRSHEGNIDHVVPRSRGGKTSWENCVLAHSEVNSRKADRLPHEAGLRLRKVPTAPRTLPATMFIRNCHAVADWQHFLV